MTILEMSEYNRTRIIIGDRVIDAAKSLGWSENTREDALEFLIKEYYNQGFRDAKPSLYVSSYEVDS
jgi:hypothetical protein